MFSKRSLSLLTATATATAAPLAQCTRRMVSVPLRRAVPLSLHHRSSWQRIDIRHLTDSSIRHHEDSMLAKKRDELEKVVQILKQLNHDDLSEKDRYQLEATKLNELIKVSRIALDLKEAEILKLQDAQLIQDEKDEERFIKQKMGLLKDLHQKYERLVTNPENIGLRDEIFQEENKLNQLELALKRLQVNVLQKRIDGAKAKKAAESLRVLQDGEKREVQELEALTALTDEIHSLTARMDDPWTDPAARKQLGDQLEELHRRSLSLQLTIKRQNISNLAHRLAAHHLAQADPKHQHHHAH